ncbi:MAG: dihydrolipoyllysine-residue acetyltransferase [Myxococcota bacterium]
MGEKREVLLPDIGDFEDVEVSEVLVSAGSTVAVEDSLIVLESDKASMEIPSPFAGTVLEIKVGVGDMVSQGALIAVLEVSDAAAATEPETAETAPAPPVETPVPTTDRPAPAAPPEPQPIAPPAPRTAPSVPTTAPAEGAGAEVASAPPLTPAPDAAPPHASPSVRRLARELGADLALVPATGSKGRILKEDVQRYVKSMIEKGTAAGVPISGVSVAAPPQIDYAKFGPTEIQPLNRIRKLSAANLHRSWVTVPHVTQFDEADITELDRFRKEMKPEAEARGTKLTFLPFVLKACAYALKEHPHFNASLDHTGENLITKQYYNVGVAVDTPAGLVVPVVRDADHKGLYEIASELMEISEKARTRKLRPTDLQGASFSISSLGGIGGTFFTPIVNHPEVAILGVGKMDWRPTWDAGTKTFEPRLILPLSLSYDHRVIDGADAARFTTRLAALLSDLRRLIL